MSRNPFPRMVLPGGIDEYRNEQAPWAPDFRSRRPRDVDTANIESVAFDSEADSETRRAQEAAEEEYEDEDGQEYEEDRDEEMMDIAADPHGVVTSADLTAANRHVAAIFEAAGNGGMTDEQMEQQLHQVDIQTLRDMIEVVENTGDANLQAQRPEQQQTVLRRRSLHRGVFPHLRALEQQSRSRNQTIFAGAIDESVIYTAQSLSNSLPGLGWTINRRFGQRAENLPIFLNGLDEVVGSFGVEVESFFWEDAIDEAIEELGRDSVVEMLFVSLPQDMEIDSDSDSDSDSDTSESSGPDPRHLPMWPSGLHPLLGLRRIEADNLRRGRVDRGRITFDRPVNANSHPPTRSLARSFPGLDIAIRTVFGLGMTNRPIVLHFLNYLAEHYIIRRRGLEGNGVDSQAWANALRRMIEDTSEFIVDEELFYDWLDPLPSGLSPPELQILYTMDSHDRGISDRAVVLFKTMYAANREQEGHREVAREASERFRAIVQRHAPSNRATEAPPIPQTLEIHEQAAEAQRRELEEQAAIERQFRGLPPPNDDEEYSDEAAFSEGDRLRNMRLEEIFQQPSVIQFINLWLFEWSEQMLLGDPDDEEWQTYCQIQTRLRRLPRDAVHRIAYVNVVEGADVNNLVHREEQRYRREQSRQPPVDQDDPVSRRRRVFQGMTPEERHHYVEQQFTHVCELIYRSYENILYEAPQEVRDRVFEREHEWLEARQTSWQDGANCMATPAVDNVRAYHDVENRWRRDQGEEGPLLHLEIELNIARVYDEWTHQMSHTDDLSRELQELNDREQ